MQTVNFYDENGNQLTGEIKKTGLIGEQKWLAVSVEGIDWAVPQGWPNNAAPICRESEPEAWEEIISQIS